MAESERMWLVDAPSARLVVVTVEAAETALAGGMHFRIGPGEAWAGRAASCLVEPKPGDLVLVAAPENGDPLIISVLTRASSAVAALSVPGASRICVTAPEIALAAQSSLTAAADNVEVNAKEGRFTIGATQFFGDAAFVVLGTVEALYQKLQSYAERLIVKAGYSLRLVDELDSTVAPTVLVQAKQTYSVQSTQTILSSTGDTRIDGERISMG